VSKSRISAAPECPQRPINFVIAKMEHVPSPSLPAGHIACLQSLSIYYCPKAATLLSRCPNLLLFMVLPNCTDLINISQYIFQMQISTVIKVTLHVTVIAVTSARL
jgi:hypothetical protein